MKTSMAVLLTVLIMLGLSGGGYYYLDKQNTEDKSALQTQIDDLTAKLAAEEAVTATADETADWKTYANADYGFSFKYPTTYEVKKVTNGVQVYDPNSQKDTYGNIPYLIMLESEQSSATLDTFVNDKVAGKTFSEASKTTINNLTAYEGVNAGMTNNYSIIAKNNSNIIEIIFNTGNLDGLEKNKSALTATQKQILSTFQFTK